MMNPGCRKKQLTDSASWIYHGQMSFLFCGIFQFFFRKLLHDIIKPTFSSQVCICCCCWSSSMLFGYVAAVVVEIKINNIVVGVNVSPRPKLRLVGLQFLKSNYPLFFMRFLLSLSSLTLFPYFLNSPKTFLFLTQIVHNTVNWQINLAIDLQTHFPPSPYCPPLSSLFPSLVTM